MSDYEEAQGRGEGEDDDYALDKANLDETEEAKEDDLQREQEGKGYGEDEGERDDALTGQ